MRNYALTINEYIDYLLTLQDSIFKILPLYEEKNKYLLEYVDETIDEVIHVKKIIEDLPHGYWYVKSLSNLESLLIKVTEDNHGKVKKKVLSTTNLIGKEIKEIEEGLNGL
ncbi:hypothetical protein M3649_04170 [Ureibacillus chungkukjangi]|uniref:hypothetical protein n=1 Tax=Ureibacillus chungkukjangi TaxID=1202712 RepID=UPI0020426155|nr:hypothetical protein [Ureibacillus chungkukjangi]MCM3387329.1 hypothetical protein [Ureibacillus chungkukjangi]